MKKVFAAVKDYIKKADMLLLLLCVASTVFGIVMIGSATRVYELVFMSQFRRRR